MNLNEHADSRNMGNLSRVGSISALKRNRQKTTPISFNKKSSLKRARVKDFVVIAAALFLLAVWILGFSSFDLVNIPLGNSPGGPGIMLQGHGEAFHGLNWPWF